MNGGSGDLFEPGNEAEVVQNVKNVCGMYKFIDKGANRKRISGSGS